VNVKSVDHLMCLCVANLTSLSVEETTSHLLATYRPTTRWPNVRHQVSTALCVCVCVCECVCVYVYVCTCGPSFTIQSAVHKRDKHTSKLDFLHESGLASCHSY